MPRNNITGRGLTSRGLRRKSISSIAPRREGQLAYDPALQQILVSENNQWVVFGSNTPVTDIEPFYGTGPGKIAIHLQAPTSGPVTTLANLGGSGTLHNATVPRSALTVEGNYLRFSVGSGIPLLANPADLVGVRLMWVMQQQDVAVSHRVFGMAGQSTVQVSASSDQQTVYLWRSGSPVYSRSFTNYPRPAGGVPRLYELGIGSGTATLWLDGVQVATMPADMVDMPINRIGAGPAPGDEFQGLMGDVLGVTLGAGSDAAIATARAYLDERFNLGLGYFNPLTPLYGTGVDQIIAHISPRYATVQNNLVQSVPDLTSNGHDAVVATSTITRTGGNLLKLALPADFLSLSEPIDLSMTRMFVVMKRNNGQIHPIGGTPAVNNGTVFNLRMSNGGTGESFFNFQPAGGRTGMFARSVDTLALFELETYEDKAIAAYNGSEIPPYTAPNAISKKVNILGKAGDASTPVLVGQFGGIIVVKIGPSGIGYNVLKAIREYIAGEFGLTVASPPLPAASYTLTAPSSVDEGSSVTFTIGSNRPNSPVTVDFTGVSAGDIEGSLSSTVNLDLTGSGTFTVDLVADSLTEGAETLTATVGPTSIPVNITISDSSVTPPPNPGEIPVVIQHASTRAMGPDNSVTVTLPEPSTSGNLIVLFALADKSTGVITPPSGFTLLQEHTTGSGVSGAVYYKQTAGGETSFGLTYDNLTTMSAVVIETDAYSVEASAMQTANAGSTSRGGTVGPISTAGLSLALASWHNDSANTTGAAAGSTTFFGGDWTRYETEGITAAYPVTSAYSPAFCVAGREVTAPESVSATFSYGSGSSDENMLLLVTLVR